MHPPVPAAAWRALLLLALVYTFNFLDRTLIYILFGPIKAELALSETQLALLGSTSFVLFYTALGVPFGRLADRVNRVRMIAGGLALWSLASAATAWAHSFEAIFLCRVLVGVGEATLGPAAISLIADLFPAERRATASATFGAGVPLGAGLALFAGGAIAQSLGWRPAFWLLGLPGLGLAAALLLLVREPRRNAAAGEPSSQLPAPATGGGATPSLEGIIARDPAARAHLVGYALFAVAANAVAMWSPSLVGARFDLDLARVGTLLGGCTVLGGLLGAALGGSVADRWRRHGEGGRMRFTASAALACGLGWVALLLAPTPWIAAVALFALCACALAWLGPALADLAEMVPAEARGRAVGGYYLVVNLVGYGLAPPLIGLLVDHAQGDRAERLAAALVACPVSCCVAALVLWRGAQARERGPVPAATGTR
ncbi:MAG: MFS transporter, partial [Deltaproteobacteria bacterium]|nr:MFS transporter [Deltaproteobacteria bacterium]